MPRVFTRTGLSLALTLAVVTSGYAANHREAPLTALDSKADITDFFAFVSYDNPGKVTLILNVDPFLEPSNGPNYSPFDPEILYAIRVDNDHDGVEDLRFEFRFNTEIRAPGVFTGFVGADSGLSAPNNSPAPVRPGTPLIPPAITALDGPGSEGFSLRQHYTVTLVRGNQRTELAHDLIAVPTNIGPRTMPDYASLADQGIYDLGGGVRVFAGTVDDPFWLDLGATFDSLNFRVLPNGSGIAGVLSPTQDADDSRNFNSDDFAGFNVNAIAIEAPITLLTRDGKLHGANEPLATIGAWGATSRPTIKLYATTPGDPPVLSDRFLQIQRMGNPLINEVLIGTGDKDRFSMSQPKDDAQFASYLLDPLLPRALNAIYTDALPIPPAPRKDLLPLVTYAPPIAAPGTPAGPVADLLRLNTGVRATPATQRKRNGLLAGDPAGFPNGRRLSDDVTDVALRVVAGVLTGDPKFSSFPHNSLGDGVNTNDVPYRENFPYLALAHSGRGSRHVDPGEPGCTGTCP